MLNLSAEATNLKIPCWHCAANVHILLSAVPERSSDTLSYHSRGGCDAMFDLSAWGPNLLKLEPKCLESATGPVCGS